MLMKNECYSELIPVTTVYTSHIRKCVKLFQCRENEKLSVADKDMLREDGICDLKTFLKLSLK